MKNTILKKTLKYIVLFIVSLPCYAEDYPIQLEKAPINTHDIASIKRGAKNFATYCLSCHALKYLQHDLIAKSAGITAQRMPLQNKQWWFGMSPPDLTLIAKIRSPNWLYTYLHVFYKDPTRITRYNNLLMDNVNMPNPFVGIQGEQELRVNKKQLFEEPNFYIRRMPYYSALLLRTKGSMSPDEFDKMTADLVNFLVYASEPKKIIRERMGIAVLIFLAILFVLLYALKRAYWKNIK